MLGIVFLKFEVTHSSSFNDVLNYNCIVVVCFYDSLCMGSLFSQIAQYIISVNSVTWFPYSLRCSALFCSFFNDGEGVDGYM